MLHKELSSLYHSDDASIKLVFPDDLHYNVYLDPLFNDNSFIKLRGITIVISNASPQLLLTEDPEDLTSYDLSIKVKYVNDSKEIIIDISSRYPEDDILKLMMNPIYNNSDIGTLGESIKYHANIMFAFLSSEEKKIACLVNLIKADANREQHKINIYNILYDIHKSAFDNCTVKLNRYLNDIEHNNTDDLSIILLYADHFIASKYAINSYVTICEKINSLLKEDLHQLVQDYLQHILLKITHHHQYLNQLEEKIKSNKEIYGKTFDEISLLINQFSSYSAKLDKLSEKLNFGQATLDIDFMSYTDKFNELSNNTLIKTLRVKITDLIKVEDLNNISRISLVNILSKLNTFQDKMMKKKEKIAEIKKDIKERPLLYPHLTNLTNNHDNGYCPEQIPFSLLLMLMGAMKNERSLTSDYDKKEKQRIDDYAIAEYIYYYFEKHQGNLPLPEMELTDCLNKLQENNNFMKDLLFYSYIRLLSIFIQQDKDTVSHYAALFNIPIFSYDMVQAMKLFDTLIKQNRSVSDPRIKIYVDFLMNNVNKVHEKLKKNYSCQIYNINLNDRDTKITYFPHRSLIRLVNYLLNTSRYQDLIMLSLSLANHPFDTPNKKNEKITIKLIKRIAYLLSIKKIKNIDGKNDVLNQSLAITMLDKEDNFKLKDTTYEVIDNLLDNIKERLNIIDVKEKIIKNDISIEEYLEYLRAYKCVNLHEKESYLKVMKLWLNNLKHPLTFHSNNLSPIIYAWERINYDIPDFPPLFTLIQPMICHYDPNNILLTTPAPFPIAVMLHQGCHQLVLLQNNEKAPKTLDPGAVYLTQKNGIIAAHWDGKISTNNINKELSNKIITLFQDNPTIGKHDKNFSKIVSLCNYINPIEYYQKFYEKFEKLNKKIDPRLKVGFSHFMSEYSIKFIQLYELLHNDMFSFLNGLMVSSTLPLERFFKSFDLIPQEFYFLIKTCFTYHKNKMKHDDIESICLLIANINSIIKIDQNKNHIEIRQLYLAIEKIRIEIKSAKSLIEVKSILHKYIIELYCNKLDIVLDGSMTLEEIMTKLPVDKLSKLIVGRKKMTDNIYKNVFDEIIKVDFSKNISFDEFTMNPNQNSIVGKKLSQHNMAIVRILAKAGIDTELAFNYQNKISFSYASEATTNLNNIFYAVWKDINLLDEMIKKLSHMDGLQKQITNLCSQLTRKGKITINEYNTKPLENLANHLNILKKIQETILKTNYNLIEPKELAEKLSTFIPSFSLHIDELKKLFSSADKSQATIKLQDAEPFRAEQWDKNKIDTFFLGDSLNCCLATNGHFFEAIVQRRMDKAMFMHVVIDEKTNEPVCGNWLFFANNKYDKKIIYVVANFFEMKDSYSRNINLKDLLAHKLADFTNEYAHNVHASDFIIRPLTYGALKKYFSNYINQHIEIEKIGGYLNLNECPDKKMVEDLYYLIAVDLRDFHVYPKPKPTGQLVASIGLFSSPQRDNQNEVILDPIQPQM